MKCNEIKNLLYDYIDDTLDPDIKKEIKNHLAACEDCNNEYIYVKKYKSTIQNLTAVKAPVNFSGEINLKIKNINPFKNFISAIYKILIKRKVVESLIFCSIIAVVIISNPWTPDKGITITEEKEIAVVEDKKESEENFLSNVSKFEGNSNENKLPAIAKKGAVDALSASAPGAGKAVKISKEVSRLKRSKEKLQPMSAKKKSEGKSSDEMLAKNERSLSFEKSDAFKSSSMDLKEKAAAGSASMDQAPAESEQVLNESSMVRKRSVKQEALQKEKIEGKDENLIKIVAKKNFAQAEKLIKKYNGKILKTNFDSKSNKTVYLVEIPVVNYEAFKQDIAMQKVSSANSKSKTPAKGYSKESVQFNLELEK